MRLAKRLVYSARLAGDDAAAATSVLRCAPSAVGEVERLGEGLFRKWAAAGEVDLLAINLLSIPVTTLPWPSGKSMLPGSLAWPEVLSLSFRRMPYHPR